MPQIGFPDWTKASIQPAYSIKFDNASYTSTVTSLTLTANTETQIDQFSFSITLPHVEWAVWFVGYVSAATTATFKTYIDGNLIDTNSASLTTTSTIYILDMNFINNESIGTHTFKFTVTAAASITLTIENLVYGIGTIVAPNQSSAPEYIFQTLLNNQLYYIKMNGTSYSPANSSLSYPSINIVSGVNTNSTILSFSTFKSGTVSASAQLFTNFFDTDNISSKFGITRSSSQSVSGVLILDELQIAESNLLIFNYPTSKVITQ